MLIAIKKVSDDEFLEAAENGKLSRVQDFVDGGGDPDRALRFKVSEMLMVGCR